MARVPAIRVAAVFAALLVIYGLSILLKPHVVYVDPKTNRVIENFVPSSGSNPLSNIVADKAQDLEDPIKDTEKEEQQALAQIKEGEGGKEMEKDAKDLPEEGDKEEGDKEEGDKEAEELFKDKEGNVKVPAKPDPKYVGKSKDIKATFVTLARNKELYDLIKSIRRVEDRFNRKFNYDWVFLNDEEFTQEFKDLTSSIVSGNTKYGLIPKEHWSYPEWIDLDKAAKSREDMKAAKIIYGDSESYRHMCRYESGFFFRHPLMDEYDWYWRVEPGIQIHCDLDYDLFKFMRDNKKKYGFAISIHEFSKTIPTLWQRTKEFIKDHEDYLAPNNFLDFISEDNGETYNLCHFWSNFEIGDLNFWRSKQYLEYFDYLDKSGGFFYERWGDAPVHSIAAALFLNKDEIHYFEDMGYNHGVYTQCPLNAQFRYDHKCHCNPTSDFTFRGYSCGKQYYKAMNMEKPAEWVDYQ